MKKKIRCVTNLPQRLYKVLMDIMPLFADLEADNPRRGAMNRALSHILQHYMESEDYRKKLETIKMLRWKIFWHEEELKQD